LRDGHLVVLRSTVYPGVTKRVARLIGMLGRDIDVSFCPERIAEGHALTELRSLPQIISGTTPRAVQRADTLFRRLTQETVELEPEEAELAKLFTNSWRYLKFAVANQLYMIANDNGLDYERIRHAVTFHYPRAADLPGAGLTAGPCLLKDTMQITAFAENRFTLGQAAVMVNEGLPLYVLGKLEERFDLTSMSVGVLGMAFKAESDDTRSSLSYKMRRILTGKAARVLSTDPYVVGDPDIVPLETVVAEADLLIIAAPHRLYADLQTAKPLRFGIGQATADVVVVTMADGSDDPMQIDQLTRLVERGVVVACASRYMRGGQQVGGPWVKGRISRLAGVSLNLLAHVGTHDATNSFKAYSREFVERVGIDSDAGFELGIALVAKARRLGLPVAELPTIWLDRADGTSNFKVKAWIPRYLHWYLYALGLSGREHTGTGGDHRRGGGS